MTVKRYAERDAMELDKAGDYYCRHVMAMTREGLHNKGDIAAELGFRDMQIDALQAQVNALTAQVEGMKLEAMLISDDGYSSSPYEVQRSLGIIANYKTPTIEDTTATDAAIREIKAQGVDESVYFMQTQLCITLDDCYSALDEFAAQLRNGEQGGE